MWKRISDHLALTTSERRIILFLAATLLIGSGIRLYRATYQTQPAFDYRASDSTFAALSSHLDDAAQDSAAATAQNGKLNLNKATKKQLDALPGIGEVTAERIIMFRDEHGPFRSLDDLTHVKGITKKKLEKFKDLLTLE